MSTLKRVWLATVRLLKQTWLLPQTAAHALKLGRRQILLEENEIERLDRLRNPSKYQGK
jgi:hypothetical protein